MNKSVAEFDTPMCCMDCVCFDTEDNYCNLAKRRFGLFEDWRDKPNWCPLKEVKDNV